MSMPKQRTRTCSVVVMLLLVPTLFVISGCGASAPKEVVLFWPQPPDEPKIAYLRSYGGEGDFQEKSFFDSLLGAPAAPGIGKPYGVTVHQNRVYVTSTSRALLVAIDPDTRKVRYIGASGAGKLALPIGVGVASDGTIFVSDAKLKRIFGYDAKGKLRIAIGKKGELKNPAGIAVNQELKRLYVVDSYQHMVRVYSLTGTPLFRFGRRGSKAGEFNFPSNVAVDRRNGNVHVVDTQNFRVQVFDRDGAYLRTFGMLGDSPGTFTRPKGIGIDSDGNVYVADAAFNNFQIFDEQGRLLLHVGRAGVTPGAFSLPAGMFVDERDRIYVVDSLNGRVQVFQYLSEAWIKENPEQYKKYLLDEQARE